MFIVVCYDVRDDRRRDRVMRVLKNYGQRVQYSVFEADLSPEHCARMQQQVLKQLRADQDNVRYYVLCKRCVGGIEAVNSPPIASSPTSYIT